MKSIVPALVLIATTPLLAFDAQPAKPSIGIVRVEGAHRFDREEHLQKAVREALRDELRKRGFEAYTDDATLADLERNDDRRADFYVQILGDADVDDYGGVGVGGRHADISIGLLVSRVAADVQIYDGATFTLLARDSVSRKSTAVIPTSIGLGDHNLFAFIALPFIERAQVRSVARGAAREMASRVMDVVRGE